jgi:ubiquinone/menaquinone biosynthesis C-methylase UbiE
MESDKKRFHDHSQAREYDRKAAGSDFRARLTPMLLEALEIRGPEWVLDLAVGTGRFARPVANHLEGGRVVGLDEALAMLRVALEQNEKEPIPGFLPTAGAAETFPFRAGVFDRAFTALALHHFGHPSLILREVRRVLKPGGSFVIVDPVVPPAQDSLDKAVHELINEIFRHGHGEHFHYYSTADIDELLEGAGFRAIRSNLCVMSVDQDGVEGVPTGRHWLEVAEQIQQAAPEMRRRFEEKYFRYEKRDDIVHVRGNFTLALVSGRNQ